MSAIDSSLIVPGSGTVFYGQSDAQLPATPLTAFALDATAPSGWKDLGHTSKENTISFSKDGGDTTQLDTWYRNAVRVVYGSNTWTMTVNALQMDKQTLDLAFSGELDGTNARYIVPASSDATPGQLVVLFKDTTDSMLFHLPNVQISLGEAPSVNVEGFFEVQLSVSILSSPSLKANGKNGLMAIYKNSLKAGSSSGADDLV